MSKPKYEERYFALEFIKKYSSPEVTLNHYVNSLMTGDVEYYQEVLGREISENLKAYIRRKPYKGKKPKIIKIKFYKDYAFLLTDNNWEVNLEKIKGRWVFSPENIGLHLRNIWRFLKNN